MIVVWLQSTFSVFCYKQLFQSFWFVMSLKGLYFERAVSLSSVNEVTSEGNFLHAGQKRPAEPCRKLPSEAHCWAHAALSASPAQQPACWLLRVFTQLWSLQSGVRRWGWEHLYVWGNNLGLSASVSDVQRGNSHNHWTLFYNWCRKSQEGKWQMCVCVGVWGGCIE